LGWGHGSKPRVQTPALPKKKNLELDFQSIIWGHGSKPRVQTLVLQKKSFELYKPYFLLK
jgi:hypothetical protein